MRRVVLIAVMLLVFSVGAGAVEKAADKRLDQKITYQGGYKRLHNVAEDLTRLTKVTIRAGSSNSDWRVRDVPVVVSVKDIPLGRLLQALATATHSSLRVTTVENRDGKREQVYRFSAPNRSRELEQSGEARKNREMAEIARAWDTIQQVGRSPELQVKYIAGDPVRGELTVTFIKLLTALDPGAKDKILAGETITVNASDNRYRDLLRQLDTLRWKTLAGRIKGPDGGTLPEHTEAEREALTLTIKIAQGGLSNFTDAVASLSPMEYGGVKAGLVMSVRDVDQRLQKALGSDDLSASKPDTGIDRPSDPSLLPFKSEKDSQLPALSRKIKLELANDVEVPVYADVLMALAESAQLNIVCEDFISHRCGLMINVADDFGKDTTAATVLKTSTERSFNTWFMDKDNNLLVGWANMGGFWQQCHANLVPASLVDGLLDKLDKGVEVDDITPIASLTPAQRNDWFGSNPRLFWVSRAIRLGDELVWQLYDSLSSAQKLLVKSEEGLPLRSIDPKLIPTSLLDEKIMSTAVMRLRSGYAKYPTRVIGKKLLKQFFSPVADSELDKEWDPKLHHSCTLEIQAEKDGQQTVVYSYELQLSFPVYSMDRERALMKAR